MSPRIDHTTDCCIDRKVSRSSAAYLQRRQKLLWAVTGVAALTCDFLFNMSEPTPHEKAIWDDMETEKMMEYLQDHAAEAGDGGNFKDPAFVAAAAYIAPYYKSGPTKTAKHVKGKYKTVSIILIEHLHLY